MARFFAGLVTGIALWAVALLVTGRWPFAPEGPGAAVPLAAQPSPSEPPSTPPLPAGPVPEAPPSPASPDGPAPEKPPGAPSGSVGPLAFTHEIPEIVGFRDYPFVRLVEAANRRGEFSDAEDFFLAMDAWRRTLDHAARLESESAYRALDALRAQLARDPAFGAYDVEVVTEGPWVLVATDGDRTPPPDANRLSAGDHWTAVVTRERARQRVREGLGALLRSRAPLYRALYADFLARFGEAAGLTDLAGPFGGRPDLAPSKRSYREGFPLVVWTFSSDAAFRRHHEVVMRERLAPATSAYYSPSGQCSLLSEPASTVVGAENAAILRIGTYHLIDAFRQQRREWAPWRTSIPWFDIGLASYLSGGVPSADGRLDVGSKTAGTQAQATQLRRELGKAAYDDQFPLKDLVGFGALSDAYAYAAEHFSVEVSAARRLFDVQAWALLRTLLGSADETRRKAALSLVADLLEPRAEGTAAWASERFAARLGLETPDDWSRLVREVSEAYVGVLGPR